MFKMSIFSHVKFDFLCHQDQESKEAKAFLGVAMELDNVEYAITSHDGVFEHFKVGKDGIVLLKKFDEGRNDFDGDLTDAAAIKTFIKAIYS